LIGLLWLVGAAGSLGADDGPAFLPPNPAAEPLPLPPSVISDAEGLTQDELDLIRKPPERLSFRPVSEIRIQLDPAVAVDPANPELGSIQPPPMQADRFDVVDTPLTLHVDGLGVESPFYKPFSPICYEPLYFEEPCLERFGDAWCCPVQSILSGTLFYARIPLLPVKMLCEPPRRSTMPIWGDAVDPAWEYYGW
jgi:hypothetical protein